MAPEKHSYTISADFSGGVVPDKLQEEIQASSIATTLDGISVSGDTCDVWFSAPISAGEKTTLDNNTSAPAGGLIGAHDGSPITNLEDFYVESDGESETTGTDWIEKLTTSTLFFTTGDYYIEWSAEVESTDATALVKIQIQCDDTVTVSEANLIPANATGFSMQSGFVLIPLDGGDHYFDVDFSSSVSGKSVSIRRARLRIRGA